MDVTVVGRHMNITESIEDHAREKGSALQKYFRGLQRIEIIAERVDDHTFAIEIIGHVQGSDHLVTTGRSNDLYNAIDDATHKMERRLTDHKEKLTDHKPNGH